MRNLSLSDRVEKHICDEYQLATDKVASMLPTFLLTLQNHMHDLAKSVESDDIQGIAKAGHKLKGALLTLGLEDISGIALRIETEGKAGNQDIDYDELMLELKELLTEIL
jgi:histidine phosphotransfer protein HptB